MTAGTTKIQRAKLGARSKSQKKYYDKNYRSGKSQNNMWHFNWIGKLPIEKLYKVYNIIP